MNSQNLQLLPDQQAFLNRFVSACRTDERVVAALLVGSYARGAADADSDLDLYVITTDDAFNDFLAGREAFVRRLGDPVFLEDFGSAVYVLFILSDGIEADIGVSHESQLPHVLTGSYRVLVDKKRLLAGEVIPWRQAERVEAEQLEMLRRQIYWFWHDLAHFITALGRGQLWWAYGQLEALRLYCVNLTRLRQNFTDPEVGGEGYFKVEQAVPLEQLSSLQASICPMEPDAMFQAVVAILKRYQELVPPLAQAHGIDYPVVLERVILERLEKLRVTHLSQ